MFPNNLCCGYILYGSLLFQLTIWYDVSKVFWHIFFLFLTVFFRIRLIRSMISDTSRVEGRSCNQVYDIILFYIASLWKTHFLFVWSNLWVSHWSCKSWYRSGCRYSGFPRLKGIEKVTKMAYFSWRNNIFDNIMFLSCTKTYFNSLSSSPNLSKYMDPQTQALFPLITMIVEELTARNIPVPPPHSKAWWTVSPTETKILYTMKKRQTF